MEKCFFDKRINCIVMEKMSKVDSKETLVVTRITKPNKDWCPSCILWQILQEMKRGGIFGSYKPPDFKKRMKQFEEEKKENE